jgi:hypothetical protein
MSTTTTAISTLDGTLRFPAHSLLSLASQIVRLLYAHYTQQYETAADEDSASECLWNLTDAHITLHLLDPVYWKELTDKRLENNGKSLLIPYLSRRAIFKIKRLSNFDVGDFTPWTPAFNAEHTRIAEPQARMRALLQVELGRIPKAHLVMPEAVKLWRESRRAGVDGPEMESEDAQLDFLIFLSEKWERAALFKFVTADGLS